MLDLAISVLIEAGYGTPELTLKTDIDPQVHAVDGVVPVVFHWATKIGDATYDAEIWLFDHGKEGITKIIKKRKLNGTEAEKAETRKRIDDAMWGMYQDNLAARAAG